MGSGDAEERRETVELDTLPEYEQTEKPEKIKRMKARAGIRLCYIAIGLVGLVSIIVIIYFFSATYPLKSLSQPLTQESIQIYREARSAVVDDVLKVGDQILGKLLPILTLLLGYVFGAREEKAENEEGD